MPTISARSSARSGFAWFALIQAIAFAVRWLCSPQRSHRLKACSLRSPKDSVEDCNAGLGPVQLPWFRAGFEISMSVYGNVMCALATMALPTRDAWSSLRISAASSRYVELPETGYAGIPYAGSDRSLP